MSSLPYVSFVNDPPVSPKREGLAAVGRCRIHPSDTSTYSNLVERTTQQAESDDDKKLQKKYMKQSVAEAREYLMESLRLDVSVVDVEVVLKASDVVQSKGCLASCFLDAGCQTVVLADTNTELLLEALEAAKLPKERLMANFAQAPPEDNTFLKALQELCFGISIEVSPDTISEANLMATFQKYPNFHVVLHLPVTEKTETDLVTLVGEVCSQLTADQGTVALVDPTVSQLGLSYAACIITDRPDGLFTTVVCSRTGEALGLVYSSSESIVAALECGRGVYYSRSRRNLWRKGDTSGHIQSLHRLDVDCDGDALRFTVTQRTGNHEPPAFCHLKTFTCWGPPRGLRHLEETLQDRLKSAPEGSYTKRLFDDTELLRNKLVEEAQELAEADTPEHVAEELADVLYFAMTRAAKAGVSLDAAVAELDRRNRKVTRRKGDSKAFRIAAGQAILDGKKE